MTVKERAEKGSEYKAKGTYNCTRSVSRHITTHEVLYGAKKIFIRACEMYGVKYSVRERSGMFHCYAMLPYFKEAKEGFNVSGIIHS